MKTVLIVEDDDSFREMLRTLLETCGFRAIVAENSNDALRIAAGYPLDAVLSDYQMPHANGLEFCRALRAESDALNRSLPVWLMTGAVSLTDKMAADAGAEGVFRKPFRVLEIAKTIQRRISAAENPPSLRVAAGCIAEANTV